MLLEGVKKGDECLRSVDASEGFLLPSPRSHGPGGLTFKPVQLQRERYSYFERTEKSRAVKSQVSLYNRRASKCKSNVALKQEVIMKHSVLFRSGFLITAVVWLFSSSSSVRGYSSKARTATNPQSTYQIYLPYISKPFVFPNCTPLSMPSGSLEVTANPGGGFQWPYFLYVPRQVNSTHALVIPNNSAHADSDFCVHRQKAYNLLLDFIPWADGLGTPLVVPVFPRFDNETDGMISSQYLGRGTLESYWQTRCPMESRIDLQLVAMIDDARARVSTIPMAPQVLLWGQSASGTFVSRFALLHPDRVQAATFGLYGWAAPPVTEWEGLSLPYPYGAGDLQDLIGQSVNITEYSSVPLYAYMGADDTNGWALPWYIGMGNDVSQYYQLFAAKFGSSASSLLTSDQTIFGALNCAATFKLYPGVGHQITAEMSQDTYNFLQNHR